MTKGSADDDSAGGERTPGIGGTADPRPAVDLQQAVEELYAGRPEEFMARRGGLVASAKQQGAKELAKQIAALRKPSKSAATLNQLARQYPDGITDLLDLGERLRQAERSVDAQQIRELTRERRKILDTLTRRAFDITGETAPSAALKEEIVSTLTAALADSDLAEKLADGTLITSASWEGFGFGGPPDLTVVGTPAAEQPGPTTTGEPPGHTITAERPGPKPSTPRGTAKADRERARNAAAEAAEERKAQAAAAAEEARRVALRDARQAVDDADEAVVLAADQEQARMLRLRELQEQIDDARAAVDEARIQLRRAEIRRRRVGEALSRLEK